MQVAGDTPKSFQPPQPGVARKGEELQAETSPEYDIITIGAGINGTAIALDAARRGLKVALIDKNDIGAGTTAYSSRLVHGGLRYLKNMEFGLVRESLRERERFLQNAPHLVRPLPLTLPAFQDNGLSKTMYRLAMALYDVLSYDKSLPRYQILSRKALSDKIPGIRQKALTGGALYYDAQVPLPERLCVENAMAAREHNASIFTHTRVDEITTRELQPGERDASRAVLRANRQATGVRITDLLTGEQKVLRGKVIINAAGSWVDEVLKLAVAGQPDENPFARRMGGTKGSHVLVKNFSTALKEQALSFESTDGRHMFIEPFGKDHTLIGTTDIPYRGNLDQVAADREEIDYMLGQVNHLLPEAKLQADDVLWAYSGVRPLPNEEGKKPGEITRKHIIEDHKEDPRHPVAGLVSIIGGKITTARNLAEEAVNEVVKHYLDPAKKRNIPRHSSTRDYVLPGGEGIPKGGVEVYKRQEWAKVQTLTGFSWVNQPLTEHLIDLYGSRYRKVLDLANQTLALREPLAPGSPNIAAQAVYSVQEEMAATVSDVLRRLGGNLNPQAGLDEVDAVADVLKRHLNWDDARLTRDVQAYRQYVASQNKAVSRFQR